MWFDWLFRERKTGYTIKGFWGQLKHYNKDGVQIGYTVRGFWGQRLRYDMNGNLLHYTVRNFWGGYNTYDPNRNLIRRSRKNFGGGFNTYDKYGKKTHVTRENFWEGLNHYEVEDVPKHETAYKIQKKSTDNSVNKKVSSVTKKDNIYSTKNNVHISKENEFPETKNTSSSANKGNNDNSSNVFDVSKRIEPKQKVYSLNDIPYTAPKIDKSTEYVSVEKKLLSVAKEDCAKLLVFSYGKMKEFPALAYIKDEKVCVEPLILGEEPFEFAVSEIETATLKKVEGLDMNAVDTEFAAVCISDMGREFEDLLPEYSWEYDGTSRNQYVFDCGMVITVKSMEQLCSKIDK